MAIYTSFYKKVFSRQKQENDVYIQVSRNLGCYSKYPRLKALIDESWGEELGNRWPNEKEYAKNVQLYTTGFANHLKQFADDQNVFLLCFENLADVYSEEDEIRFGPSCKAGEHKVCHRTWLSNILNKKYGYEITEWNE